VREGTSVDVDCSGRDERVLPQTFFDYEDKLPYTFFDYEDKPREYLLSAVNRVFFGHSDVDNATWLQGPLTQLGRRGERRTVRRSPTVQVYDAEVCAEHSAFLDLGARSFA
jgi:hypothetical protein